MLTSPGLGGGVTAWLLGVGVGGGTYIQLQSGWAALSPVQSAQRWTPGGEFCIGPIPASCGFLFLLDTDVHTHAEGQL